MFAKRLREIRIKRGITQEKIAEHLDYSRPTYTAYESGRRRPDNDTLVKIAKFLDVSVDYLLCLTDIENPQDYEQIKSLAGDDPELLEILKRFTEREDLKIILKQLLYVDKDELKPLAKMISGLVSEDKKVELIIKNDEKEAKKHIEELSKDSNYRIIKD